MIQFYDTSEIFDTSRFKAANVGDVIYADVLDPHDVSHGRIIHFVRDTDFGCEMRSRFWPFNVPDVAGLGIMMHCYQEMGNLADFLPDLCTRETSGT